MNDTLAVHRSNYDLQGPTAYHDHSVITQLFNDLRTLEAAVVIEQNLSEYAVIGIPEPFRAKQVEEKTKTTPRYEVSSIFSHSPDQPAPDAAQHSSSLVFVQDFSVVEDVVNFLFNKSLIIL